MIRCMRQEDAAAVLDIYRDGIDGRNATFETVVPEWEAWDRRHLPHSRFVFGKTAARFSDGWRCRPIPRARRTRAWGR